MSQASGKPKPSQEGGREPPKKRRVRAEELFGGASEIIIEHHGEEYRLRITKQGKLILTK